MRFRKKQEEFSGCCRLAGVKYVNEDGTIDRKRAADAVSAEPRVICDDRLFDPCRCLCHRDGEECFCWRPQ
jgi:hypothetical protein